MPEGPLRILIYNWKDLTHPAAGGAEVYTEGFARELAARGHSVTLFVSAVEGQPADEVRGAIRYVRRGGRLGVYREARKFWKTEGDGQFDVVLDEVNTRPFLTPRYVRGTPVVALIHQLARDVWQYEVPAPVGLLGRYVMEPWWLRSYRSVPVLTDSPSSAQSFEAYGIRGAIPLPIGAAPIDVPDVPKEARPTVVFLGRLVESKRPHHVVEGFRLIEASVPGAQLWLIGDGPYREEIEKNAGPNVHVFGRVSSRDREERLTRAHVLVTASVREGWGLNVSEAAACGTPTIGYRAPGLIDSVPASGGHLVEPNPQALARALTDFFSGDLTITPTSSIVTWPAVADAVEEHLRRAISGR
jgi:glycosyltransferase involved in cell wall biosynthesis